MIIKTITCHDVYNSGASLQAYALASYLHILGHEVEIIDYRPGYLSNHFPLLGVSNPEYDKPFVREAYQLLKLPGRIKERHSRRKQEFDRFTREFLPLTPRQYFSNEELTGNPPVADLYIAGSDQIWNSYYQNGKDPAFYLQFAPVQTIKASYAASFSTDTIKPEWKDKVTEWIQNMDYISVRESSALALLYSIGIHDAALVLDPVFLLSAEMWKQIEKPLDLSDSYILIYDFDNNPLICRLAHEIADRHGWKVYSVLQSKVSDRSFHEEGPLAFLWLIDHAEFVISNSFHATAFSIIFHKQFLVADRMENINP